MKMPILARPDENLTHVKVKTVLNMDLSSPFKFGLNLAW